MNRELWTFHSAGEVVFGHGAISRLPSLVRRIGARRVALITDPGIEAAGVLASVLAVLRADDIDPLLYAQAMPEPDLASVRRCRDALAEAHPDLLIALGGGSSIDLAKIVAAWLSQIGLRQVVRRDHAAAGQPVGGLVADSRVRCLHGREPPMPEW